MSKYKLGSWLFASAAVFLTAAMLTIAITSVEDRLPFGPSAADAERPEPQVISVYVRESTGETRLPRVSYFRFQIPRLDIVLPGGMDAKVIVNRLASPDACEVVHDPYESKEVTLTPAAILPYFRAPRPVSLLSPTVSPVDVHIVCAIRPLTRAYTYSKRTAAFWFLTPMRDLTAPPPDDAGAMQPAAADPLEGYEASPAGLLLSLDSIQGAEGFSYDNGIEPRGLPAFEASRILRGGMTLNAYWQDIYAEQRRDIILVVIGALIGIGATMLIEALRPMVDRLFDLDSVDNT